VFLKQVELYAKQGHFLFFFVQAFVVVLLTASLILWLACRLASEVNKH